MYVLNMQIAMSLLLYEIPVTGYICLYQKPNLKIDEYTTQIC